MFFALTAGNVPTATPKRGSRMQAWYEKSQLSTNISLYLGNDIR